MSSNGGPADNVGTGAPYRPPCGGWATRPIIRTPCHGERNKIEDGKFEPHPDGWPKYKNVTQVPCLTCDGTFSETKKTNPFPIFPCELNDLSNPECPEGADPAACAEPECARGMLAPPCPQVVNIYEPYDPPQVFTPSVCRHRGFKNVFAAKNWHGRYGFGVYSNAGTVLSPNWQPPINGTKYLKVTRSGTYEREGLVLDFNGSLGAYVGSDYPREHTSGYINWGGEVNRYSGIPRSTVCESFQEYSFDGRPECATGYPPVPVTEEQSIDELLEDMMSVNYQTDNYSIPGNAFLEFLANNPGPYVLSGTTHSMVATHTAKQIRLEYTVQEPDQEAYPSTILPSCGGTGSLSTVSGSTETRIVEVQLEGEYTASDLHDDVDRMLALWDLCNDALYPWRISGPQQGPLLTYSERAPTSPEDGICLPDPDPEECARYTGEIIGAPLPIGYDAYWDSSHANLEFVDVDGFGTFCWVVRSWGASSPYPHATQWTEDNTPVVFPYGSIASYNSPQLIVPNGGFPTSAACGTDGIYRGGALIKCKYAEVILYEKPSHNRARPCGSADRETIDPETIDCVSNPAGDLRWPNAPCFCNDPAQPENAEGTCDDPTNPAAVNPDNDTGAKGTFSLKSWGFDEKQYFDKNHLGEPLPLAGSMVSMDCTAGCVKRFKCAPSAVFIQNEPLTGKYAQTSVRYGLPNVDLYDGDGGGFLGLKQVHQHMIDPLWKRPGQCEDETFVPDMTAIPPIEENDECAQGICDDYVARVNAGLPVDPRCHPGQPQPWND